MEKLIEINKKLIAGKANRDKVATRVKEDFRFASGLLGKAWTDENKKRWGKDRAEFDAPLIAKNISGIIGKYRANPFGVQFTSEEKEQQELIRALNLLATDYQVQCDAQAEYALALQSAVISGYGYLHCTTVSKNGETEIIVENITNPLSVLIDPKSTKINGSDADWVAYVDEISKNKAKELYGEIQIEWGMSSSFDDSVINSDGDSVSLITFYEKTKEGLRVAKVVGREIVEDEIIAGLNVLPIVPVYGETILIDGEIQRVGIVQKIKDIQTLLNFSLSLGAERLALSPKAGYIASAQSIGRYAEQWKNANRSNPPVLLWDATNEDGTITFPPPQKQDTAVNLSDVLSTQQGYLDLVGSITGIPDEGFFTGNQQKTAEEILTKTKQQETIVSSYFDNLSSSIKQIGAIIKGYIGVYFNGAYLNLDAGIKITDGPMVVSQRREAVGQLLALSSIAPEQYRNLLFSEIIEKMDDVTPELRSGIKELSQQIQKQTMENMQVVEDNSAIISDLEEKLQQANQKILELQAREAQSKIKAEADLLKTRLDFEKAVTLEQLKADHSDEQLTAKLVADAQKETAKQEAELEKLQAKAEIDFITKQGEKND